MTAFFLDSSALVKRYFLEQGTAWTRTLLDPASENAISVAEIALVEVAAACAAKHRASGGVTQAERDAALALFRQHFLTEYSVAPLNRAMIEHATNLTQQHRLRGYDAVQLAVALAVNDQYAAHRLAALTFVTADVDLAAAATAEGLAVDNPNYHP